MSQEQLDNVQLPPFLYSMPQELRTTWIDGHKNNPHRPNFPDFERHIEDAVSADRALAVINFMRANPQVDPVRYPQVWDQYPDLLAVQQWVWNKIPKNPNGQPNLTTAEARQWSAVNYLLANPHQRDQSERYAVPWLQQIQQSNLRAAQGLVIKSAPATGDIRPQVLAQVAAERPEEHFSEGFVSELIEFRQDLQRMPPEVYQQFEETLRTAVAAQRALFVIEGLSTGRNMQTDLTTVQQWAVQRLTDAKAHALPFLQPGQEDPDVTSARHIVESLIPTNMNRTPGQQELEHVYIDATHRLANFVRIEEQIPNTLTQKRSLLEQQAQAAGIQNPSLYDLAGQEWRNAQFTFDRVSHGQRLDLQDPQQSRIADWVQYLSLQVELMRQKATMLCDGQRATFFTTELHAAQTVLQLLRGQQHQSRESIQNAYAFLLKIMQINEDNIQEKSPERVIRKEAENEPEVDYANIVAEPPLTNTEYWAAWDPHHSNQVQRWHRGQSNYWQQWTPEQRAAHRQRFQINHWDQDTQQFVLGPDCFQDQERQYGPYDIAAVTDVGESLNRQNSANEDKHYVQRITTHEGNTDIDLGFTVLAVVDGGGGQGNGEKASDKAIQKIQQLLKAQLEQAFRNAHSTSFLQGKPIEHLTATERAFITLQIPRGIREGIINYVFQQANAEVFQQLNIDTTDPTNPQEKPTHEKSIATAVIAILDDERHLTIGNVGDAGAYVVDNMGNATYITQDQNAASAAARNGIIEPSQVFNHKGQLFGVNLVYNSLGAASTLPDQPYITTYANGQLPVGTRLILSCDAVRGHLGIDEDLIGKLATSSNDTENVARNLIAANNQIAKHLEYPQQPASGQDIVTRKGGGDNGTVMVVQVAQDYFPPMGMTSW